MDKGETKTITTVTVHGASAVAQPDGSTALVLETVEAGSIAFEVDLQAIAAIRRQLDDAETFLKQPRGSAKGH